MKRSGLLQLIMCASLVVMVSPVEAQTTLPSDNGENNSIQAENSEVDSNETKINNSSLTGSEAVIDKPLVTQSEKMASNSGPTLRGNYSYYLEARELADANREALQRAVRAAISENPKKLGYLKGSTLEIVVPNVKLIPDFYYLPNNANIRFSGMVGITDIYLTNDDTVRVTYKDNGSQNGKLTFTKLKNAPTNTTLNFMYSVQHSLRTYRKMALLGWTQIEDEEEVRSGRGIGPVNLNFAEPAPELVVTPKEETTRLAYGSTVSLEVSDYYNVKTSAGKVTATFLTQPDTSVLGPAEATIQLTDEYGQQTIVTVPFEVFETLVAQPVAQTLVLGQDIPKVVLKQWVKDVTTLSGDAIDSTDYEVELVSTFSANAVGTSEVAIRIFSEKYHSDLELTVPVTVKMGTAIQLTNTDNQIIGGVTVNDGKLDLVDIDDRNVTKVVGNNISIAVYKPELDNPILNESTPSEEAQLKATDAIDSFKSLPIGKELPEGSVIKVATDGMAENTNLLETYNDGKKIAFIDNNRIHEQAIYYLYQNKKFSTVAAAHLEVKTVPVSRLTSLSELDAMIHAFYHGKLPGNVSLKGFSSYPNTAETGLQAGKVLVEEQLGENNVIRYDQPITIEVDDGDISMKVPTTMNFKDYTFNPSETTVERAIDDWQLEVDDTRMDSLKTNWHINLKVSGEQELDQYMTFVDYQNNRSYLTENITIYSQDKIENQPDNTSISWGAEQGVLLQLPAHNNLKADKTYHSTLEWSLILGEE
ncbi:hypothetical protein [Brochothrix campestris]|uniref:Wall-associated protein n=1 Tax=Brochothrix campestris FSL F6-1037 TaxID=1265861 RepID=W7CUK6_9LIST|nr:hypothetical protein [Brochothrix campestris]EUJ39536.1 wall-associated protein [Brochothrix campestris FSL F6-1037]